jgi:uroporphyrinogen decarboxylase
VIVFPRGSGVHYTRYGEIGANAVSIDFESDIASLRKSFAPSTALQGNLDPATLIEGGDTLRTSTAKILTELKGTPHIFNLGHGVRPETPVEHVEALVRQIRAAA